MRTPSMFILAHNILANTRTNADPENILRTFYSTSILQIVEENYTPTNFIGGYFDRNARPTNHSNWLNSTFEKLFNPVIGRALIQRPTLVKARLVPPVYPDMNTINAYDFLLCYSESNIEKLFEIITDVSSFFKAEKNCTKVLSQVLENATGINIMYHSLWSTTLPTWHKLPPPTVTSQNATEDINDVEYARLIKYMTPGPIYKSKLEPPTNNINANLYLVSAEPYSNLDPPFRYELFDRQRHVYPDVLWFQPYH